MSCFLCFLMNMNTKNKKRSRRRMIIVLMIEMPVAACVDARKRQPFQHGCSEIYNGGHAHSVGDRAGLTWNCLPMVVTRRKAQ